jgi:hypothetical protein
VDTPLAGQLIGSLDTILFELGRMDDAIVDTSRLTLDASAVHELRRRVTVLHEQADALMNWVRDLRLTLPMN